MEKKTAKQATAQSTITEKKGGVSTTTKDEVEQVGDPTLFAQPTCNVGVNAAATINTGDFNNVKVGCSLNIPCTHGEIDDVFNFAKEWVDAKMNAMIEEVQANN